MKWVAEHESEFGADGSQIAIAGNSVGGNMTAALTLMSKDRKGPKISYQVLFVPATDASVDTASYHEFATGRFLPRAFMKYGWDLYAPDEKTRNNPYVSPLRASVDQLKGLPPALVVTAENDPLRDEGEAYARKLKEAGVKVDAVRYNGTIHDFMLLNALRHEDVVPARNRAWQKCPPLAHRVGWQMSALVPLVGVKRMFHEHGRTVAIYEAHAEPLLQSRDELCHGGRRQPYVFRRARKAAALRHALENGHLAIGPIGERCDGALYLTGIAHIDGG